MRRRIEDPTDFERHGRWVFEFLLVIWAAYMTWSSFGWRDLYVDSTRQRVQAIEDCKRGEHRAIEPGKGF